MKIHIASSASAVREEIIYLFKIIGINKNVAMDFTGLDDDTSISIGAENGNTIRISQEFIDRKLAPSAIKERGLFEFANGEPDDVSTAFFCLTMLQEYADRNPDNLGRFQYKNSYQHKYANAKQNLVQECFDRIGEKLSLPKSHAKTTFFLTHDIDTVNGAILEDGFNVMKKGRLDLFFRLLFNAALAKPDWLNIDKIMQIESEYDCKSTFFWIMNKGRINKREENADYDFSSRQIQHHFYNVNQQGFENGIHKSISDQSFKEELKKYGSLPLANRYHYLKFHLPEGFDAIEQAGLKIDASVGFAEEPGFRNSYGLPCNPFNFKTRNPYAFVEVPLHIMDRTYFQYKRMPVNEAWPDISDFFERNKENCVLSVLWHNNFFTSYKFKGYLELYKKILAYIRDNNFSTITQKEMIGKYSIVKEWQS